ncbi:MAG: branched-chain amino acid ABC transporter permease [Chloroflexi bacterium]|nr:branched-chain amino acid ABC transporter permease [Chloroflexota bacterium]
MSDAAQYLVTGLTLGSIYALVALGFVTVFSVTGVINFAQGEFVMLGAMLAAQFVQVGAPLPLAALLAVAGAALVGALVFEVGLRPARGASELAMIIITIGASTAIRGAALLAWGTDPRPLAAFTPGPPIELAGAAVVRQSLWVLGATAAVLVALHLFFSTTAMGRALRACAVNAVAARLVGISPRHTGLAAFVLSGAVGAVAGVVLAPLSYATYDMGLMLGLKGFVGAVLGGMANPSGAVAGGLALGLLEAFGTPISSAYKDAAAFIVLILAMLLRPGGLFGRGLGRGSL